MRRSDALRVVTVSRIVHFCPYYQQDRVLHDCYRKREDIAEREHCYGCDHVQSVLKPKYGLLTYRRKVIAAQCSTCNEPASLHEDEPPYAGTRVTTCKGFTFGVQETKVYVPLNVECTEWMVVETPSGRRHTLASWTKDERYSKPLLGAPGTYHDAADAIRIEAAEHASKRRRNAVSVETDEDGNTIKPRRVTTNKSRARTT